MLGRGISTFVGLLPFTAFTALGFLACSEDSTTSPAPAVDGGALDASSPPSPDGAPPIGDDGSTPPADGAGPQKPAGYHLRFAHLAESHKDEQIDFCIKPQASDTFTLVYAPLGAPGLKYGEVGRFVPVQTGVYDYVATTSGSCDDTIADGTVLIPTATVLGSWALSTFALTLTSTGVVSVQATDFAMQRSATQDRITVFDGTGPRDALAKLPVSWIGSTTVSLDVPNNARSINALVPAGESGKIVVGLTGNPEIPVKTVAGGHAMVVVYGIGQMRVCDYDAPFPTTGALSTCAERN